MASCLCSSKSLSCIERRVIEAKCNCFSENTVDPLPSMSPRVSCWMCCILPFEVTLICKQSSVDCSGQWHHRFGGCCYYVRSDLCLMFRATLLLASLRGRLLSRVLFRLSFSSPGNVGLRAVSGIHQVWEQNPVNPVKAQTRYVFSLKRTNTLNNEKSGISHSAFLSSEHSEGRRNSFIFGLLFRYEPLRFFLIYFPPDPSECCLDHPASSAGGESFIFLPHGDISDHCQ